MCLLRQLPIAASNMTKNRVSQGNPDKPGLFYGYIIVAAAFLVLGLAGVGYTIGAASGPFLTGYIFDSTGHYRVAFMVGSAVSFLGLILVILLAPKASKLERTG